MGARIATALVGGVLLLVFLLYDFFLALVTVAMLHAMALYEFARLDQRLTARVTIAYVLLGTLVLTVCSMALAKLFTTQYVAEIVPGLLAVYIILIAAGDLLAYDRSGTAGQFGRLALGALTITVPFAFVAPLAHWPGGFPFLLLLIGASFGADVGGMIGGKLVGRRKLVPRLSPHKTWEGLIAGLLSAAACWMVTITFWPPDLIFGMLEFAELPSSVQLALAGAAGAVVALFGLAGDLTFSLYKRQHNVKDYGTLLPGHGGVLDRFDAFIYCAPLVYLLCLAQSP